MTFKLFSVYITGMQLLYNLSFLGKSAMEYFCCFLKYLRLLFRRGLFF
jgi:hypothetical protein